jgi:hypothetical protein
MNKEVGTRAERMRIGEGWKKGRKTYVPSVRPNRIKIAPIKGRTISVVVGPESDSGRTPVPRIPFLAIDSVLYGKRPSRTLSRNISK